MKCFGVYLTQLQIQQYCKYCDTSDVNVMVTSRIFIILIEICLLVLVFSESYVNVQLEGNWTGNKKG